MVIIWQYIQILKHCDVYLKLIYIVLYINYVSIKNIKIKLTWKNKVHKAFRSYSERYLMTKNTYMLL